MENNTRADRKWYDRDFSDHQPTKGNETKPQPLVTGHSLDQEDLDGKLIKPIRQYDKIAREYD